MSSILMLTSKIWGPIIINVFNEKKHLSKTLNSISKHEIRYYKYLHPPLYTFYNIIPYSISLIETDYLLNINDISIDIWPRWDLDITFL